MSLAGVPLFENRNLFLEQAELNRKNNLQLNIVVPFNPNMCIQDVKGNKIR